LILYKDYVSVAILHSNADLESIWLSVNIPNQNNPFILNATYCPPKLNTLYHKNLSKYIISKSNEFSQNFPHATTYVTGDFNDFDYKTVLLESELCKIETPPTRGDACLDLIFCNNPSYIKNVKSVTPSFPTDHLGLIIEPNNKIPKRKFNSFFRDDRFKFRRSFNKLLEEFDFSPIYNISDFNTAAEYLENTLSQLCGIAFPIRQVKMSNRDPKWITPKIKFLLKIKKRHKNNSLSPLRENINNHISQHKINSLNKNSKDTWRLIEKITNYKLNNNEISCESFEPNELNNDLTNRSKCFYDKLQVPELPPLNDSNKIEITLLEVLNVMLKCRKTSPGPGDIPYWVFNEYWDILAPLYCFVWNLSLRNGRYPKCYKNANLIPIPKIKLATNANEIRGISVTPIASRLFEKIIHNKYISPIISLRGDANQFAFKKNKSTLDALAAFYNYIITWLNKKHIGAVHCIAIDFSKAFDVLNQEIAYSKFSKFFDCNYLKYWLYDFSKNRKQRLIWKSKPLDYNDIDLGCSQGTVGGPNIFNIFTDDLKSITKNGIYIKYADDTVALVPCYKYHNEDTKEHQDDLNKEINNIFTWSRLNKLPINSSKSKHIIFSLSNFHQCRCNSTSITLPVTNNLKYLGILFQPNLRFTQYMEKLIRHLNQQLFLLRDLKLAGLDSNSLNLAFNAFVMSKIRYALPIYASDTFTLQKLESILEKCLKRKYIERKTSIQSLLTIEDQKFLNRILADKNHPLNQYLTVAQTAYNTRRSNKLQPKCATSNIATNSFIFRSSRKF